MKSTVASKRNLRQHHDAISPFLSFQMTSISFLPFTLFSIFYVFNSHSPSGEPPHHSLPHTVQRIPAILLSSLALSADRLSLLLDFESLLLSLSCCILNKSLLHFNVNKGAHRSVSVCPHCVCHSRREVQGVGRSCCSVLVVLVGR